MIKEFVLQILCISGPVPSDCWNESVFCLKIVKELMSHSGKNIKNDSDAEGTGTLIHG